MPLWPNLDDARERTLYGLAHSDILEISDNEIIWLTGEEDFDAGIRWVWEQFPQIRLVLLSLGADDSWAYSGEAFAQVPCFRVITIETTGAGDTFFGGVLHHVPQWGAAGLHRSGASSDVDLCQRRSSYYHHPKRRPEGDA